jgi:CTD small phosphatase-like protein 2
VYTASHKGYAEKVIETLDPDRSTISHSLYRDHCFKTKQGVYIKDLRILNRSLKDVLLVDNALFSYGFQLDNGVPIIPYYNLSTDRELLALSDYLMTFNGVGDVREKNRNHFKYNLYNTEADVVACHRQIFQKEKVKAL